MSSRRHPNVVNIEELGALGRGKGRFGISARRLGKPAGAKAIGINHVELQPSKTSFPCHFHTGIEEGIYVLSGSGEMRIGPARVPVKAGDYIAFPPGPDHAHTLTNTGQQTLQYLSLSNQNTTDVVGYPDSNKFLFIGMADPTTWPEGMWVRRMIKDQESVDYFEGEDAGE